MFSGCFVAIVTPFVYKGGRWVIDFFALASLIKFHAENGVAGIVFGGCTGEAFTLTISEQKELFRFGVAECRRYELKAIAGTGSNNLTEALELTQFAAAEGVDAVMPIVPYGNKPTQEGIIEYYTTLANAVPDTKVMLYDVPGRTGVGMTPQTVATLYNSVNNIVAIKAANGNIDWVSEVRQLCKITILSGDDSLTIPMMVAGAVGVVSVTANVLPRLVADAVTAFLERNLDEAMRLHHLLFPLHKALFTITNPIPVKAALARMGRIQNHLRSPLVAMSDTMFDQHLLPVMQKLGILSAA